MTCSQFVIQTSKSFGGFERGCLYDAFVHTNLFLQPFVPLFDAFGIVKACLGVAGRNCFWPSRSGAAELVSLPVVEVLFCLALGQVESRLVPLLINPRSRWPMGPTWPLAEEPPIWAFNWKSLGSGNVGTVRTDFVPSMCSTVQGSSCCFGFELLVVPSIPVVWTFQGNGGGLVEVMY
jgi:hypothetical protein